MPEGDTLWRTAAALRQRLVGQRVREARPEKLTALCGSELVGVEAHGKHLLMQFSNELILRSHMRMTGSWHLYAPGQRWRKSAHLAVGVLSFDTEVAVLFDAPVMDLVASGSQVVDHLGPDILADELQIEDILSRARVSGAETVGELLLDQRVCAGIGNIYKCESLWQLRLDPWQRVASTEDEVLTSLYRRARSLMRASLTATRFRQNAVHGRAGRACPRCHRKILLRAQGGTMPRQTFYCAVCQIS